MSAAKFAFGCAVVPLVLTLTAPANAQLIARKDMSYPMALAIAQGALEDCKARGYAVSVVVVDRAGANMVTLRADGAGPHTMENARRKAYTALTFKMTTEEFAKRMQTEHVRQQQATLTAPANAQLIARKDMSYPMALAIAQGALEDCKARGYAVSVVVVDRAGANMVTLRADGAGPHTMENARRKAYTALTFKMTTEEFAKRMQTEHVRQQQATLPGVIGIPGGVPVKVGNDVIAGVGLSGSPGVDEPCVQAGLAKVADQLK